MILPRLFLTCLTACLTCGPVFSHEFWIEPQKFQVKPGDVIVADFKNGQRFSGTDFAWFDSRILRSQRYLNGSVVSNKGRAGDVPALTVPASEAGLMVIAHETTQTTLTYRDWEKFSSFVADKGLGDARLLHDARNLPAPPFKEGYTRLVKSLVAIGDGRGQDIQVGMEFELVAQANPYIDPLNRGLPVQLIYQNAPRPDTQIEIFDRSPTGTVTISKTRTDSEGMALISLEAGHDYMLDAVVLRVPDPIRTSDSEIVWETLWTSLTFSHPRP